MEDAWVSIIANLCRDLRMALCDAIVANSFYRKDQYVFDSLLYSARVSFLQRPDDFEWTRIGQVVNFFQTIFSPILLGLLALAIRQRLMR